MIPNFTFFTCITVVGFILCAYFSFLLFSDLNMWYASWGLYGDQSPLVYAGRMLRAVAKTNIAHYLYGPLLALILIIVWYFANGTVFPNSWTLSIILFQLHIWIYQAMPPAVLLLGNSRPETVKVREQLERGLFPYRIIVLLDSNVIKPTTHSAFQRNLLEWDNLSTSSNNEWRSVVHSLMYLVPAVILDTRIASPSVTEEFLRILKNPYLIKKAIFIIGANGEAPVLDAAGISSSIDNLVLTHENQLIPIIKNMGLTKVASPDDITRLSRL